MDGSDKRLKLLQERLNQEKAKKAAMAKKAGDKIPSGKPNKPNPFVDIDNPAANVAKYGRKFVGPKGSKGTSYSIPTKKKGKR